MIQLVPLSHTRYFVEPPPVTVAPFARPVAPSVTYPSRPAVPAAPRPVTVNEPSVSAFDAAIAIPPAAATVARVVPSVWMSIARAVPPTLPFSVPILNTLDAHDNL